GRAPGARARHRDGAGGARLRVPARARRRPEPRRLDLAARLLRPAGLPAVARIRDELARSARVTKGSAIHARWYLSRQASRCPSDGGAVRAEADRVPALPAQVLAQGGGLPREADAVLRGPNRPRERHRPR